MLDALVAGQASPHELAGLARGNIRAKTSVLQEALTGHFTEHHAFMLGMMLDRIDALTGQIGTLTTRIEQLIAAIPAAQGVDADGTTGPGAGTGPGAARLDAITRLDEVPGISAHGAQIVLAEIGLDMT